MKNVNFEEIEKLPDNLTEIKLKDDEKLDELREENFNLDVSPPVGEKIENELMLRVVQKDSKRMLKRSFSRKLSEELHNSEEIIKNLSDENERLMDKLKQANNYIEDLENRMYQKRDDDQDELNGTTNNSEDIIIKDSNKENGRLLEENKNLAETIKKLTEENETIKTDLKNNSKVEEFIKLSEENKNLVETNKKLTEENETIKTESKTDRIDFYKEKEGLQEEIKNFKKEIDSLKIENKKDLSTENKKN